MGARRRSIIGAGMESAAKSLGAFFEGQAKDQDIQERQKATQEASLSNQSDLKAQEMMQNIIQKALERNPVSQARYAGVNIDPRDAVGAVGGDIAKAKSNNEALTPEDITNLYRSHPGGNMTPDYFNQTNNPSQDGQTLPSVNITTKANPNLRSVLEQGQARAAMLQAESNKPDRVVQQTNPDGSQTTMPVNPRTMGNVPTGLSGADQGKVEAAKLLNGQLSGPVVAGEVKKAGRISGAQAGAAAAAQDPFKAPTIEYDENGLVGLKWNPKTRQMEKIELPPGLSKTGARPLSATEVDNVASMNTAEIEGVKVLAELHKAGLDKSNDPLDPRWAKFVVGTLKMAPGDYQKADVQQRAAYVKAALTRAMMGSRPSQYIAKIIQEHIPDGAQTGEQMSHVMNNVLQQVGEKRGEIANVSGKKVPGPVNGSYENYLKAVGTEEDPTDAAIKELRSRRTGLPPMAPMPAHKTGGG